MCAFPVFVSCSFTSLNLKLIFWLYFKYNYNITIIMFFVEFLSKRRQCTYSDVYPVYKPASDRMGRSFIQVHCSRKPHVEQEQHVLVSSVPGCLVLSTAYFHHWINDCLFSLSSVINFDWFPSIHPKSGQGIGIVEVQLYMKPFGNNYCYHFVHGVRAEEHVTQKKP